MYEIIYGVKRTVDTKGTDETGNDNGDYESVKNGKSGRMAKFFSYYPEHTGKWKKEAPPDLW